jgi:tetratricopeptide (TPR) repeat protein
MYSSVDDLFKWDQALYTYVLVSKESKEKIFTPYMNDYGYGWQIQNSDFGNLKKKTISHSGDIFGFSTIIIRFVDDNNCIILLNNFSNLNLEPLSKGIAEILYNMPYDMPKKSLADVLYKSVSAKTIPETESELEELKKSIEEYSANEDEINLLGYELMEKNKLDEAIEVFKFNVDIFPNSSNVYDSLGEAYLKQGNTELAMINYKKSVELNPKNESGMKILKSLQSK